MRSELLLIPFAIVASVATPARAGVLLTTEQAQKLLFPGATFTPSSFELTPAQYVTLHNSVGAPIYTNRVRAWRVSNGGWFIVDVVLGRDDNIDYAIALNADGMVTGIEIMECLDDYGGITNPAWRRQFVGLKRGQVDPDRIHNFSGASLSSRHIAEGIQRTLVMFDLFLRPRS